MADTKTLVFSSDFGNKRVNLFKISCTSYVSGGIPCNGYDMGMTSIDAIITTVGSNNATADVDVKWDSANNALIAITPSNGAQFGGTNNLATTPIWALVIGS